MTSAAKRLDFGAEPRRTAAEPPPEPFEYFADPTPRMLAAEAVIGAAYEQGRALHGDEDSDAWIAALEDGTHPLCRIKTAA